MLKLIQNNRIRGQALEVENEQRWNKMLLLEEELNKRIDIFNKGDRNDTMRILYRNRIDENWKKCEQLRVKHATIEAEIKQIKEENRCLLILYLLNYRVSDSKI